MTHLFFYCMLPKVIAMEKIVEQGLLYDFYGELLTDHQKKIYEDAVYEDMSLGEIAGEYGISRQGVHDALKNAEKSLRGYEEKLGLVAKFQKSSEAIKEIDDIIENVIGKLQAAADSGSADAVKNLKKIKSIIDKLED